LFKNSRKQGDAGLGQAIAWLTMKGYAISIPLTDNQDYDLVAEIDGDLKKIQVKTGTRISDNGIGMIYLNVDGGNRSGTGKFKNLDDQHWDYLFGYHLDTKEIIFIPKNEICSKSQINLGEKYRDWISKI